MPTTVFVISKVHPDAGFFYRQFPSEPLPPAGSRDYLTVTNVVGLDDFTVETMLDAIIRANVPKKGSILIICHGNDRGIRLAFGAPENQVFLEGLALRAMTSNLTGKYDDQNTATTLKYNLRSNSGGLDELKKLKALIRQVAALELSRVDFRACNTGKDQDTLRQLQVFFNADLTCAPDIFDTFGLITGTQITSDTGKWSEFKAKHPNPDITIVNGKRFALGYKILGTQNKVDLASIADSQEPIDAWVRNNLPPGNYTVGPFGYHGLLPDKRSDTRIMFAGQVAYREHLVEVSDGKVPLQF